MLKRLALKAATKYRTTRRDYVTNTLNAITGHDVVTVTTTTGREGFLLTDAIDVAHQDRPGARPIDITLDAVAFTNEVLLTHQDANPLVASAIRSNTEYAAEALRLAVGLPHN